MSSTPTVETLSAKGHGGGGEGNFRGSRNAVISDASSLTHKKVPIFSENIYFYVNQHYYFGPK